MEPMLILSEAKDPISQSSEHKPRKEFSLRRGDLTSFGDRVPRFRPPLPEVEIRTQHRGSNRLVKARSPSVPPCPLW